MRLGDLLQERAASHPDRAALFSAGAEIPYALLNSASTNLASWLLDQGLQPGDRIAIHWPNSFEAVVLYFAAFKSGIIAVPVNLRMKPPEIAHVFANSGARFCFSAPALVPLAEAAAASCPDMRLILSTIDLSTIGSDSPSGAPLPARSPRDTAVIMYTSGTTARPKGVEISQGTFLEYCRCVGSELVTPGMVIMGTTPIMHVGGLAMTLSAIYAGASKVLVPGFDPAAILDAIERYRCTVVSTLPALLRFILDEQARMPRDISSVDTVLVGGDTVPLATHDRLRALCGISLREYYGMTEGGIVSITPKDSVRPGSMGIPVSAMTVRIVDAQGRDVPAGERGEIILRGPTVFGGYWNDPEATSETLRDGWLHTGDLARQDEDGYLWFLGRVKQIIVRAGSNISPQEVEEALYQHPDVREAGVVGQPDAVYGETVVAFVSLHRPEAQGDESILREFTRERLADYKTPERIIFLPELPKGLTGKVDRRALKATLVATG